MIARQGIGAATCVFFVSFCPWVAWAVDAKERSAELVAYEEFALRTPGDVARGKLLFESQKVGCLQCHVVGGDVRRAGPNLAGIGDKYSRKDLIHAVLEPNKSILAGYSTSVVVTRAGEVLTGIVSRRGGDAVELFLSNGQTYRVSPAEVIAERPGEVSLMPSEWQELMTQQELADLITYLEDLTQPGLRELAGFAAPEEISSAATEVRFEPFHEEALRFKHPVWFAPIPGTVNKYAVVENDPAKIWVLEKKPGGDLKTLFVDLSSEAHQGMHMGLMGLAFHPKFLENRKYYLNHHILENGKFGAVIIERHATADYLRDAGVPSRRLLSVEQWTNLHTGGMVAFGPDNYLYIGTGDGGPQEDPEGHAQSLHHLLGALLRIDVDGRDPGLEYAIPESNPFSARADPFVRREIWARGLRQAWRFSFDPVTHDVWVGDVGQVRYEEITLVRAGENHGWNVHEGFVPFSSRFQEPKMTYVQPVVALARKHGASVTGGYVYRGVRNSSFRGVYIFGDYESKKVWGLTHKDRKLTKILQLGVAPDRITTFGEDRNGEMYLLGYDKGMIYHVNLDGAKFE